MVLPAGLQGLRAQGLLLMVPLSGLQELTQRGKSVFRGLVFLIHVPDLPWRQCCFKHMGKRWRWIEGVYEELWKGQSQQTAKLKSCVLAVGICFSDG